MKFNLGLLLISALCGATFAQESGTVGFNGTTRTTAPDDLNYRAASVRSTNVTIVSATGGQIAVVDSNQNLSSTNAAGARALIGAAAAAHTHGIADTTGLQGALDGKASSSHAHAIADTTGLQAALDGKAPSAHNHAVADVTGLQAALDGKAASSHTHADTDLISVDWTKILNRPAGLDDGDDVGAGGSGEANTASSLGNGWKLTYDKSGVDLRFNSFTNSSGITITSNANMYVFGIDPAVVASQSDLSTGLSGKAALSHTHAIADTTGLQGALDGKAALSHSHAIADVTGLQTALDGKAAASHSHSKADLPAATHEAVLVLTVDDLADGMNYVIGYVGRAFTIAEIRAVHSGTGLATPSVQLTVNQGTDRTSGTAVVTGGSTITSTTTGNSVTSFTDATVPANSWLWITTGSKSGTTDNLEVIVRGSYD